MEKIFIRRKMICERKKRSASKRRIAKLQTLKKQEEDVVIQCLAEIE